jgi:hypothetical protein
MTKPFRVEEQVEEATLALKSPEKWPSNFYNLLRERDVEPLRSVMVNATPDQGCICIRLVDQQLLAGSRRPSVKLLSDCC